MSKAKYKKLSENTFERTDTRTVKTILNKQVLEETAISLESGIAREQGKLARIKNILAEIKKVK